MGRDRWIIAGISVAWIGLACAGYWFLGNGAENFERASELTRIDGYITQYEAAKLDDKEDLACMLAMTIEMSYIYIRERESRVSIGVTLCRKNAPACPGSLLTLTRPSMTTTRSQSRGSHQLLTEALREHLLEGACL